MDSELTLLYGKLKGSKFERKGVVPNPFFGKRDAPFRHPLFPIYLVTRLAAYDWTDVKAMIDRSLAARNRGKFVLDLQFADDNESGNDWLRNAAILLPTARVVLDETNARALRPEGRDRLRLLGIERPQPEAPLAGLSVAAGRDRHRVSSPPTCAP